MGTLNKGALKAAIVNALTSVEPGIDSVDSFATILTDGIDAFVKSGTVDTVSSGGGCNHSGIHPFIPSTGKVS